MANAGCINAIGFDGTYLRTLQNLDSANIGVGVQFCAPNPLDDKRLDYIKYTDKCGCTCCLRGENEILIYATQGVLKNFTLTNDDTNERVNVKWNDLFGSNRAYTMVRYKTGGYPTSITDGTLAVKEMTQNQYASSGYNVSGLTDGTTYYFTAFAVSQDGTIIVVQNKSITPEFAFHGYQRVEYIQSSSSGTSEGTNGQRILTGITPTNNTKIELKISNFTQNGSFGLFGSDQSRGTRGFTIISRSFEFGTTYTFDDGTGSTRIICDGGTHEIQLSQAGFVVDGNKLMTPSTASFTGVQLTLFAMNRNGTYREFGGFRLYYCKLYESGTLTRDYYPVYRKSDNVIGLFDKLNRQFYTNSGSGSFTKGPDVN